MVQQPGDVFWGRSCRGLSNQGLSANQKRWDLTTKTNPDWELMALTS